MQVILNFAGENFWSIRNFSKKYETKLSPIACTKAAISRKQSKATPYQQSVQRLLQSGVQNIPYLSNNEKYKKLCYPICSKTKLRQKSLPYSGFPWHLDDSEQVTLNKEKTTGT